LAGLIGLSGRTAELLFYRPKSLLARGALVGTVLAPRRLAAQGRHLLPRRQLPLPDAPLTLTNTALMALRTAARAMGVEDHQG